ncbi:helix-turn-helix domain-containing protein [Amycolatopsis nigrescens]|uniref:helix-turn-helix domain-containing protein n=1 Tax=Amycolatopsis nigrescens TaxID=381445 RepID=UPI000476460F|nr:helix-turn-helix transcriptional regulator [Amycolatopsis nigrescens]
MVATTGTPRVRALASAMRQAREAAGLGVREVGKKMGIGHSTISYWETGKRVPKLEDIGAYLQAIGVTGEDRDRILDLGRNATDPDANWLAGGIPGISPALGGVLECERTAQRITEWSPFMMPGLLQASVYARAIIGNDEHAVMLRNARRDILATADPTEMVALIGESALHTLVGGTEIHLEQLRYLVKTLKAQPNIELRVVPTGAGWHRGLIGGFVFYEFAKSPPIVYAEHQSSSAFIYEDDDVAEFGRVATTLRTEKAMSPENSLKLIAEVIDQMERTQ